MAEEQTRLRRHVFILLLGGQSPKVDQASKPRILMQAITNGTLMIQTVVKMLPSFYSTQHDPALQARQKGGRDQQGGLKCGEDGCMPSP